MKSVINILNFGQKQPLSLASINYFNQSGLTKKIKVDTPVRNAVVEIGRENSYTSSIDSDEANQEENFEEEYEGSEEERDGEEDEDSPNEDEVKHLAVLSCRFCHKMFSTGGSRTHHEKYMHLKQKGVKCRTLPDGNGCGKMFSNETSLRYHRLKVHKEAIVCYKCRERFTEFKDYLKHRRSELSKPEPPSKVKCDKCQQSISRDHFRRHMKEVHKIPQYNPLQEPARKHHSCIHCDKQFTRKENMKRHVEEVHSSQKSGRKSCGQCGKSFTLERNLTQHLEKAHSVFFSTFSCDHCKKSFKQKTSLNRHQKEKHAADDMFSCPVCNKTFVRKANLLHHNKTCQILNK